MNNVMIDDVRGQIRNVSAVIGAMNGAVEA